MSCNFDWAEPDEEMHTFVNELECPVGTYFYGRRIYEVMAAWERMDLSEQPPFIRDYAEIWRAADKIVYSRTLEKVSSTRTRLERDFDPGSIRRMKALAGSLPNNVRMKLELLDERRFGNGVVHLHSRSRT
jgi:hypothetical protein